jgi:precorrin-3B synthase
VLRLIDAQDGQLARVRLPGGFVSAAALRVLADAAVDLGDGRLELTSRGNVQVRGLAPSSADELAGRLGYAGLTPSATHERVRNIVASPLAGIDRGPDLGALVNGLDLALCADARLAALPGRFLFAIDDGRGDVGSSGADVVAVVRGGSAWVEGRTVAAVELPAAMLRAAHAFLDECDAQDNPAWHVEELTDGRTRLRERIGAPDDGPDLPVAPPTRLGPIRRLDGRTALVVAPPLGRLTAEQARWIAAQLGSDVARITPWRSVVLPEVDDRSLGAGLIADPGSPWRLISACAGRPRCAQALADVQADAAAALGQWPGRRVHWSGCDRCCGRTPDVEVDVIATAEGYAVRGQ